MIALPSSSTSSKLQKFCEKVLKASCWIVATRNGLPVDFAIESGILKYDVVCVDKSIMEYKSVDSVVETMESYARNKKTWIPMLFVLNFRFPFIDFDQLIDRKLVVLSDEELELIGDLPSYLGNVKKNISDRQRALLEINTWACIEFATLHRKAGAQAEAMSWARKAIKPTDSIGKAHHVVFGMLLQAGEVEEAYNLASEAVLRRRDDIVLLRGLIKISEERGDVSEINRWKRLIDEATDDRASSFDKLFRNSATVSAPKESGSEHKSERTLFGFWRTSKR
jgi:hypothetical protein